MPWSVQAKAKEKIHTMVCLAPMKKQALAVYNSFLSLYCTTLLDARGCLTKDKRR